MLRGGADIRGQVRLHAMPSLLGKYLPLALKEAIQHKVWAGQDRIPSDLLEMLPDW